MTSVFLVRILPGRFNWTCANILIGSNDPFSTAGADAFEKAAIANQINVCTKAEYKAGSVDMKAAIKKIVDTRCCLVTVVFGQTQDLTSLLLEAHSQQYDGEWIVGDNILGSLGGIARDLKRHLKSDSSVHKLLRGMYEFTLKDASQRFPQCHL